MCYIHCQFLPKYCFTGMSMNFQSPDVVIVGTFKRCHVGTLKRRVEAAERRSEQGHQALAEGLVGRPPGTDAVELAEVLDTDGGVRHRSDVRSQRSGIRVVDNERLGVVEH